MNESDIATIGRMLDELAELEAASEQRDDPHAEWEYNLAVEQFGRVMANVVPRLFALARRGLELDLQLERGRMHQEIDGRLAWEKSRQKQNQ